MSIEALKSMTANIARQGQKSAGAADSSPRQLFEDLLKDAANPPQGIGESSQELIAAARLSHLQMIQGLFAEEHEEQDDLFLDLNGVEQISILNSHQSQMIDKYIASQKPALHKPAKLDRGDIDQLIDRVAAKVSLAPELIRSVVTAESAYQPDAVSHAGAQGLMQLMPETARELGVRDSFDPHENLLGGSQYLKQLLDKYSGDLDHALAAYNWGQGNVDRHGLNKMPEETRQYLAKIKAMLNENTDRG